MFGRRKEINEVPLNEPEIFRAKHCDECGVLVKLDRLKQVEKISSATSSTWNYCSRCAPQYNRVFYTPDGPMYDRLVPEHWVRVNADGTPVEETR